MQILQMFPIAKVKDCYTYLISIRLLQSYRMLWALIIWSHKASRKSKDNLSALCTLLKEMEFGSRIMHSQRKRERERDGA